MRTITFFMVLFLFSLNANEVPAKGAKTLKCDAGQFDCVEKLVDMAISSRQQEKLDEAISKVEKLEESFTWKDNFLGVLYMLKKDNESMKKSETLLLKAHKSKGSE